MKSAAGQVEAGVGRAVGSDELQDRGAGTRIEGQAQKVIGSAQDALNQAAEGAKASVSRAADTARDLYGRAQQRAQSAGETVDPFVRERPYAALGIAAVAGLVAGVLLAGRGPRVVYVKPRA